MEFKPFLIALVVSINLVISAYIFAKGYLAKRVPIEYEDLNVYNDLKKFNKSIFIYVDSLSFQLAVSKTHGLLNMQKIGNDYPNNSRMFRFLGDVSDEISNLCVSIILCFLLLCIYFSHRQQLK